MTAARIGYAAMLEQFGPTEVVGYAALAERHGFSGVVAADHSQPWVPPQGQGLRTAEPSMQPWPL